YRRWGDVAAEAAAAATLFTSTFAGIPVSTTHTITWAIVGVGTTHRFSAVRWGLAGRIVWAWIFTIPASAAVAGGFYLLCRYFSRSQAFLTLLKPISINASARGHL